MSEGRMAVNFMMVKEEGLGCVRGCEWESVELVSNALWTREVF